MIVWYSYYMKISNFELNDSVTFKHGESLEFVDTGIIFHIEDNCLHVEVKELDEVFEIIAEEIVK